MEASEPKKVNHDDIEYGVNSLRLGSLQITYRSNDGDKSIQYKIKN